MSSTSRSKAASAAKQREAETTPCDSVSALEAHLGYWLRYVSNHVSHAFKLKVEREGVTVAEWVVMRSLLGAEGIKPSELAERVGLTRGAISKLVDRLAAKELVLVRADAHDGRAQQVRLSAAGRKLVPRLAALADQNDAEAFGVLTPVQRDALLTTLKQMVERLGLRETPVD